MRGSKQKIVKVKAFEIKHLQAKSVVGVGSKEVKLNEKEIIFTKPC